MIYGRIRSPKVEPQEAHHQTPLRDKAFALRMVIGLGIGLLGGVALFLIPAFYFVEQNYEIFTHLAYDVKPTLVQHLEREMIWLRFFLIVGLGTTSAVGLFYARRLVRHLLKPLEEVEDHLRAMSLGQWDHPLPKANDPETYRTFFISYENFHQALRLQAETDLRLLQKIEVDPQNRDAVMAWNTLVKLQMAKLGLDETTPIESAVRSSEVVPLRRVS